MGDGVADASRLGRAGEAGAGMRVGEGAADGRFAIRTTDEVSAYRNSLPTQLTPSTTAANRYEIGKTGPLNYRLSSGSVHIDADGIDDATGAVLEAKYVGDPSRSPFISDSGAPAFIREAIDAQVRDEIARYGVIIADQSNPLTHLRIITNHPRAVPYFKGLLSDLQVPGFVDLHT
jgi:hypothetical protein